VADAGADFLVRGGVEQVNDVRVLAGCREPPAIGRERQRVEKPVLAPRFPFQHRKRSGRQRPPARRILVTAFGTRRGNDGVDYEHKDPAFA
jgi:hypothetical protein